MSLARHNEEHDTRERAETMGDGVTGPGNAPANQAGRGAPSRSTDNGDKAKFDSALDQEKKSSRTHNGGKQAPAADKQVMDILDNPHLDENAKATELRKALADLPDSQKRELYERLKDRTSHDPLAQKFRDIRRCGNFLKELLPRF